MLNKVSEHPLTGSVKDLAIEQLIILYEEKKYQIPATVATDTVEAYNKGTMTSEQEKDMKTINERMLEKA